MAGNFLWFLYNSLSLIDLPFRHLCNNFKQTLCVKYARIWFSLIRIFPNKGRIFDSVPIKGMRVNEDPCSAIFYAVTVIACFNSVYTKLAWLSQTFLLGMQFENKQNKQKLLHFCCLEKMANNFQLNTVYFRFSIQW